MKLFRNVTTEICWSACLVIPLLFSVVAMAMDTSDLADTSSNVPNSYPNRLNARMDSQLEYPVHGLRGSYDDESGPYNSHFSPQYPRSRHDQDEAHFVDRQMRRRACNRKFKIKNGNKQIRRNGALVGFRCNPGYTLIGATTAVCNEGKWSEEPPICVTSGCSQPRLPMGLTGVSLFYGALWTFHCQYPGYMLIGSKLLVCDGQRWNGTIPSCLRMRIPTITTITTSTTTLATPHTGTTQDPYETSSTTDDMNWDQNWPTAWPSFPPIIDPTTPRPSSSQQGKYAVTVEHDTVSRLSVTATVPTEMPDSGIIDTTPATRPPEEEEATEWPTHQSFLSTRTASTSAHKIVTTDLQSNTNAHELASRTTTAITPTKLTTIASQLLTVALPISSTDASISVGIDKTSTTTSTTITTTPSTSRRTAIPRNPFQRRTTKRGPYRPSWPRPWAQKSTLPPSTIEECLRKFINIRLQTCFNRVNAMRNRTAITRSWRNRPTYRPPLKSSTEELIATTTLKQVTDVSIKNSVIHVTTPTLANKLITTSPQEILETSALSTVSAETSAKTILGDAPVNRSNPELSSPVHYKLAEGGDRVLKIVSVITVITILAIVVGIAISRYWRRYAGIVRRSDHEMDCRKLSVNHDVEDEFVYVTGSSAPCAT